ncbi:MAG: FAD-dependent oxidoreductase [Anaerovoracaceae bacterium]|jgi:NADPH-dependent 2,4-dienoyl-CoA reductase/sulfur reductase-like enzyme/peroxiredoxin family protein/TusA-related sulfurtransferase/rhodanese-related sulfurtransferase
MKTVIIGGVAGGATAAARLRRLDENMEIVLLERGDYISYANCGLPYYVGDVIKDRSALLVSTPETMRSRFNIDVRTGSNALKIDKDARRVTVNDGEKEYQESYDNLLIATGSDPLRPPIPGIDNEGIYTVWTVPDIDAVRAEVDSGRAKSAVVIGGGFIGIEMAENLRGRGLKVDIAEAADQVMAPFDPEMANLLHENIEANGIGLHLGDGVKSFEKKQDGSLEVTLSSGITLGADIVILAIGLRANSQLAKDAGLELTDRGSIVVDKSMRTSDPHIWAVGDVVQTTNRITGEPSVIRLAGPANKQGRIVAGNIAAASDPDAAFAAGEYDGFLGTSVAKVCDLTAASTGINEKALKAAGKEKRKDYETILISQKSHAGYYPLATQMFAKLIFDKSGKIYGAQIIGQDGVDKRIDMISAIIGMGGTVSDLKRLEQAYAPPYSSAKDPVNMLGFTAENVLNGLVRFASWDELEGKEILDVSEDVERQVWSMPGSVHIPFGQVRDRLSELDKSKSWVVYCAIGVRSYNVARILMQNGFEHVEVLEGGSSFYKSVTYKPTGCSAPAGGKASPFLNAGGGGNASQPDYTEVAPGGGASAAKAVGESEKEIRILDCTGLQCPGPIMKVNKAMQELDEGEVLKVSATDNGFARDVRSWCDHTGNTYIATEKNGVEHIVTIQKGAAGGIKGSSAAAPAGAGDAGEGLPANPDGLTMIVFDQDLDKAIASFIIANGALAMGKPVTMFFTFWGLNILRKNRKVDVKKQGIDKMFGRMMPRGTKELGISNMNMLGMGPKMIRKVMQDKNVDSIESLMEQAIENGAKIYACSMSMDIMGIKKEELIDGIEYVGVASYLGATDSANVNLFI